MIFLFSFRDKVFLTKTFANEPDPSVAGAQGVEFSVWQKYAKTILPFMPITGKKVTALSLTTGQPIPHTAWTPAMKQKAKEAKSQAKGSWKLFMIPILILSLIAVLTVYRLIANSVNSNDLASQTEYRENPQGGDICYASVTPGKNTSADDMYVTAFKITRLSGDTVFVVRNQHTEKTKDIYNLHKIAGKFKSDDSHFNKNEEVYSLQRYIHEAILFPLSVEGDRTEVDKIRVSYWTRF